VKILRCCFFSIFIAFLLGNAASADTELLNISSYSEGDTSVGENVIVGIVENSGGEKYLTGHNGIGKIQFPINLSSEFEVSVNINCINGGTDIFIASEESQIKVEFGCYSSAGVNMYFQGENSDASAWIPSGKNDVKVSVKDSIARLYINDVFSNKFTLTEGDLTYTRLIITGITDRNALYEVRLNGSGSGTQPPPVTGGNDFEAGKQAGIQQCVANPASCGITVSSGGAHATYDPSTGEVHIPFIEVPRALGGVQTYDIYFIQQPLTFTFDLDMGRITPR
jgi:hypothetical protein